MKLHRDQDALDRPQRNERRDEDQRQPERRVDPIRRGVENLHGQRREYDQEPREEHREERRPVGRIDERIVEPAGVAARSERQEALEQLALAAAWTAAGESMP